MKTGIVVNLQIEGVHRWEGCNIESVSFLKNNHRHVFYITCKKNVSHLDRDIEIIMFKREIKRYIEQKYGSPSMFSSMSCEMIAQELFTKFGLYYCCVLEDNENGAEVML